MKNFLQWAVDAGRLEETEAQELATKFENTKRSGIRGVYPAAYAGRGYAYPDNYFTPIAADAPVQLKNAGKK